jgi:hypothetical protein
MSRSGTRTELLHGRTGQTGDKLGLSSWQYHMARSDASSHSLEELPYLIELWHAERRDEVESVLARALNAELARAIFNAAASERPERRITLRRDSNIIADSSS